MIRKINMIKKFGIFQDFNWDSNEQLRNREFKEKNIIYGWNYAGKTTLSRIFASLRDKTIHDKYTEGEFKITIGTDNTVITQNDLNILQLEFQVFNSDYIRDNLKWETNCKLEGISFDVGGNVKTRESIEKNNNLILRILGTRESSGRAERFKKAINEFNQFEQEFSDEARKIKIDIFNSLIEFNKGHLKTIKSQIEQQDLEANIILNEQALQGIKKISISSNDKSTIESIIFEPALRKIYDKVCKILRTAPQPSELISILEEDNGVYLWAKQGLETHISKELKKCSFCDNLITSERIEQLKGYFSNASAKLREDIVSCRNTISIESEKIDNIAIPNSKNDFTDKCQDEYSTQLDNLVLVKEHYLAFLSNLNKELDRKETGNIFNSIDPIEFIDSVEENLINWIGNTQKVIAAHNSFINNFNSEQSEAREKLKNHHIALFLKNRDYYFKEGRKKYSERCIKRYDDLVIKLKRKNNELEAQLKNIVAGKQQLNNFINAFLNRDDINIEVTEDDKFLLKRGDKIAENLSEGEKMAISFAHFLVSLESLHRIGKLKETIIFIDDPISSLDANHISHIYSLINSFFFRQNQDPNDPNAFASCFRQLFISTHNFEFFSFLKDSTRINKKNTNEYFFIKRTGKANSEIQCLPKPMRDYKSEYIYLFGIIYSYYDNGCQESCENLILLPNAVRRFLEIYTLIKLPDSKGEVDSRLRDLLGEPNQLKTLHHFSHFTTFEKISKHDELLMNLPQAVKEVIKLLEKDNMHFESLKRAIG